MRRTLSGLVIVVLCVLMVSIVSAETVKVPIDLKKMSLEELQLLAIEIDNEISIRKSEGNVDNIQEDQKNDSQTADKEDEPVIKSNDAQGDDYKVLLDQNGVRIYISGKATIAQQTWVGSKQCRALVIPIVIENNSDYTISPVLDDVRVNGWSTDGTTDESGGVIFKSKTKCNLKLEIDNTDVKNIEDFSEAVFVFQVYKTKDWFGKKLIERSAQARIIAKDIQ